MRSFQIAANTFLSYLMRQNNILRNYLRNNGYPSSFRNARHADGVFTSDFSRLLGQLSAKKYLESLIGKRVG